MQWSPCAGPEEEPSPELGGAAWSLKERRSCPTAHLRSACEQPCIPGRLWPVPAFQDLSSDQLTLAACEGLAFLGGPKAHPSAGLLSPFGQPPPQQPEAILEGRARNRLARVVSRFFRPSVWAGGWGALLGPKPPRTDAPGEPRPARGRAGQPSPEPALSAVGLQGCQQKA